MAHYKFDLVQETSTSTGATTMALAGAVTRRRRFGDVLANADTCYVFIEHASAAEWQICLATWNTGHSLTLGAVLASSTGVAVTFSAGTKTISIVAPAAKSIVENNNGDVSVTRDAAIGRNATVAGTLGVTGAITGSAAISAGTSVNAAAASGYLLGGAVFAIGDATYRSIYDGAGANGALVLGNTGDPTNYYRNTAHAFANRAGSSTFATINSTGLSVSGSANLGTGSADYLVAAGNGSGFPSFGAQGGSTNISPVWYTKGTGSHIFNVNGAGGTTVATLNSTGLGVGKAPAVKLDVSGAITASSAITSSNLFMLGDGSHGYFRTTTGNLYLGTGGFNSWLIHATGNHKLPGTDNTYNLGSASFRVKEIFAGLAAINTSGRAAKLFIGEAIEAEKRAAATIKANPRRYKMADAVAEKGDAARWHFGYIAEDVRDALAAEGLDPWAYAFLCSDPLIKSETYFETATRQKMRKVTATESVVEIIDGKPVMVRKEVERDEPVGEAVAVVDEAGEPIMQKTGEEPTGEVEPVLDGDGKQVMAPTIVERDGEHIVVMVPATRPVMRDVMAPLMHFVPEMEEYEIERTREVDTGEVRLGLRYSELEAFLRSAD